MAVAVGVSVRLCKHLDRFKKAQRPNEQRFSLDSRTVFLSQTWKIIHALEQEVDAAYRVVKIAVDSTDIGVPTDGFTVVDGFVVEVGIGLTQIVTAHFVDDLHVPIVKVGQHIVTRIQQRFKVFWCFKGLFFRDETVHIFVQP